ncbi:MAG: hypothetical protein WAL25_01645 [Acidimicrobiia bacterium]
MTTVRGRLLVGSLLDVVVFGAAVAAAREDEGVDMDSKSENASLPPFLAPDAEVHPGVANREVLPPGLAKKLEGNTPPGQANRDGEFIPPGLAKKDEGWLPPGLAE